MSITLPEPLSYRPYLKGVYQVAPLLRPFGSTQENAQTEEDKIFQVDNDFDRYRETKIKSLSENPDKYFGRRDLSPEHEQALIRFIIDTLCRESPEIFSYTNASPGISKLICNHTQDELCLDEDYALITPIGPAKSTLEALSLQIQEDFALWRVEGNRDWMALGSICLPNHWSPEEKFGQNFFTVHQPIAESGPMIKNSAQIVKTMIHKGPFVRFAWGMSTDTRLNHHPEAPPGIAEDTWQGRSFNDQSPELWVRSERQCLVGFPELEMSFFTIRTYFENAAEIKKNLPHKVALQEALRSMTPASLEYKGLSKSLDSILNWLDA